jgi:type 1 fimbria pilin
MKRLLVTLLALGLIASVAFAHNGMIHVMGTVTALSDSSITVETTDKKTVEVALNDVTTYENGSKQSTSKDLKMGDCVVIHAVKVKDSLQAHDVRFSESTPVSSR